MAYLTVENLTHIYGVGAPNSKTAIKNVSFNINKGETVGIIGHTGSGKSTLVNHLNGLMKPTSGRILIDGADIWDKPKEIKKIRAKVGLVFQYPEYQLFEETVYKDIAFGPSNLGISGNELDAVVRDAAAIMQISDELLQKSPFDLSGGQKRRVAIAGVLAMHPEIIVFDEPTAGLDPIGRTTIFKAIADYKKKYDATVLIVSHSMEDIAALTDKILVMNSGEVAMFDETRKVFSEPDKLKEIGLGVPMISDVFADLNIINCSNGNLPLTVDDAVILIDELLKKGGKSNA